MEAPEILSLRVSNSLIPGIVIVGIVIEIGRAVNWLWLRPKRLETCLRRQNLRGNSYRLGFGDLKEMAHMIQEAKSKPINLDDRRHHSSCPSFSSPNDSKLWQEFLPLGWSKSSGDNCKPRRHKREHNGEKWMKHRRVINPAFHLEKLKLMLPAFYESCNGMIKKWVRLVNENESGCCEINVWPFVQTMTSDVISRTAFGSSYEEGQRIFQLQTEQILLTLKVFRSVYIPGWRFVPTKLNRRLKEIDKEIQASMRGIIHKREKAREAGQAPSDDLLDILLESNKKEIKDNGNNKSMGMSIEDVIGECKLFYLAGQETTGVLLNWTIMLLCKYPNWQSQAREEVFQVFGTQTPDYDGLNRLKLVSMILYEVLRLYPGTPTLTRVVSKNTRLGNLTLPVGTRVVIPVIQVQQDSQLWGEDAKEFNPQRFSEGISKATKSQCSYVPFAWGPRICPGQNFALLEAKMALYLILQNFTFELSPSYAHAPFLILTLQPQHGTHIILRKL
ncbi:hypothetical protein K1719_034571 [Acacia pycnantha]|nr:hypothetical protein K1719_034571 [Acacia pycnantha]